MSLGCRSWALLCALLGACSDPTVSASARRDFTPPRLDVLAPARGAIAEGNATSVEVRGNARDDESGIDHLTVNGVTVPVAADGSFTTRVTLGPGVTLIHTELVDRESNTRSETRAVLAGDLVPADQTVADGMEVRLDKKLLAALGDATARKLDAVDLDALAKAKNPIVDAGSSCLRAKVEITQVHKGAVATTLVPVDGGLALDASIADLSISAHIAYSLACSSGDKTVIFSAKSFRLAGPLAVALGPDGKPRLDASQVSAAFDGFDWGGDLPSGLRDFLELPLGNALAAFIGKEVQDRLPGLIGYLGGNDHSVYVGDQKLVIALRPSALRVDPNGLYAALDTRLYMSTLPGAVFPRSRAALPALDAPARALGLAVSDDALNEMLASMWAADVFSVSKELPLGKRLDEVATLANHVEMIPRLPPVVEALPDGAGLRVTLADVDAVLDLRADGQPTRTAGRLAVTLRATFAASIKDDHLTLTTTAPHLDVDVLPDPSGKPPILNEDSLRALGDFLTDTLLQALSGAFTNVPLPALDEITVSGATATSGGSAGGYLVVTGDVAPR
jgi:hypothetical protein